MNNPKTKEEMDHEYRMLKAKHDQRSLYAVFAVIVIVVAVVMLAALAADIQLQKSRSTIQRIEPSGAR